MSEEVNNSEDNDKNKSELVIAKSSSSSFGVGGVGSLALVGLVLIVLLTVLIVRSQNSEEDVLSFAPANSFYALEVENIEGAADILHSAQIWKGEAFSKEGLIEEFASWFGADSVIIEKFTGNIRSVTFVETLLKDKPEKMLILRVGNGWDIERYYRREYSQVAAPIFFAPDVPGLQITRPDKSIFYLKKVANFVVLTETLEMMNKALNTYKEDELSLAACNVRFGDGEDDMPRVRLYTAINSFLLNYPEYRRYMPESIAGKVAGDSAFLYEATLNATGFIAEGRFIKNEAAGYASGEGGGVESSGGFFSTLLWVVFIIIIIIIVFPILFVAFTLLLALYFFILAWWKGELVPIDPPLKDLSDNLKEDLGVGEKSAEDTNRHAEENTLEESARLNTEVSDMAGEEEQEGKE